MAAETLATFPYKSHVFRKRVRKVIISEEKWRVFEGVVTKRPKVQRSEKWGMMCGEVRLRDVNWGEVKESEVKWSAVMILVEMCV